MSQRTRLRWSIVFSIVVLWSSAGHAGRRRRVLFIDARVSDKQACVAIADDKGPPTCEPIDAAFFEWEHGVELQVWHRQFETDYAVQIDNVIEAPRNPVRGLPEVTNLTIGVPLTTTVAAAPPPSKGAAAGVQELKTADFLAMLLDEAQATRPQAILEGQVNERARIKAQAGADLAALKARYDHLTVAPGQDACPAAGGDPAFDSVVTCLTAQEKAANDSPNKFSDEAGFRVLRRHAKDAIDLVTALQAALTRADLPGGLKSVDADLLQLEQLAQTVKGDLAAASQAARLYRQFAADTTLRSLRRDQLRVSFSAQLKADDVVDAAEINTLVDAYVHALAGAGFATANASRLQEYADRQLAAAADEEAVSNGETVAGLRRTFRTTERSIEIELPARVARVNAAQSRLVSTLNAIYDQSSVAVPLVKQIDLSKYAGKNVRVTYSVYRTEGFPRSAIVTPIVAAAAPATDLSSREPVAKGTFAIHNLDRAAIVAAFVYTGLRDIASGTGTEAQQHVLLGVNYYVQPRDSFPGQRVPLLSRLGVLGGVSVTRLSHYFLGLSYEPVLGVNLGGGVHLGTERVPGYEKRAASYFVSAGLDVEVFRKVFGKVVGLGVGTTPGTAGGQ